VSYDTTAQGFTQKAGLFSTATRYSTAYVGSSNLTHQHKSAAWNGIVRDVRAPEIGP